MYKLVFVGTVAAFAQAHNGNGHPIHHGIVEEIKEKATTWKPFEVEENPLKSIPADQLRGMLGTFTMPPKGYPAPVASNLAAPGAFDARQQWGACIHPIRDQQQCGSCWAFGATEAFSDRYCIETGDTSVILAPEDLVQCDSSDYGCNGGYLDRAWEYLTNTGAVSDACDPYTSGSGYVTQCVGSCEAAGVPYQKYKCQPNTIVEATNAGQI